MSITPSNPPNQVTEPNAAIPAQLVQSGAFVSSTNPLVVTVSGEATTQTIVNNNWICITQFVLGSTTVMVNDILQQTQVFNTSFVLVETIWQDLTQQVILTGTPPMADIELVSGSGLTNAELRASPVPFTTTQLASTLGQQTSANSASVVVASDQSAIPVTVTSTNPSVIISGQQAVTGSAVALASHALVNGIVVTALVTNANPVYVGPSGVTSGSGYVLVPGQSISYGVTNSNHVYILGTSGDNVTYTGN